MNAFLLWVVQAHAESGEKTFWLPEQASTLASQTDKTFYFIYWVSIVFFIVLMGAMVWFAWVYRKKSDGEKTLDLKGSHVIEFVWAVFPSFLLIAMFVMGFKGYLFSIVPPADSMEVLVTGAQWNWAYQYPESGVNVASTEALVIPKGKAVRLKMVSTDVIHSYYVPDFRVKKDVVPNRYSMLWFETTGELTGGQAYMYEEGGKPLAIRGCESAGTDCEDGHAIKVKEQVLKHAKKNNIDVGEIKYDVHQVFCTEYCGNDHSRMLSKIVVLDEKHFDLWIDSQKNYSIWEDEQYMVDGKPDTVKIGSVIAKSKGCKSCHEQSDYPQWNTLFDDSGKSIERAIEGSSPIVADAAYIIESVRYPGNKIVSGYGAKKMNAYPESMLSEKDLGAIIDYMKSLK